jgi:lipoprotein-anchoring transpeptidase ErfK/SrfK
VWRLLGTLLVALATTPPAAAETSPFTLELRAPRHLQYGQKAVLQGRIVPALGQAPVTILRNGVPLMSTVSRLDGRFAVRLRAAGPAVYEARAGELASTPVAPIVRPRLATRVQGLGVLGRPLRLVARLTPAAAGRVRVTIRRNRRLYFTGGVGASASIPLRARRPARFDIHVVLEPAPGWTGARRALGASLVHPRLALGSRGPSVRALERRLRDLSYALPGADGLYGLETVQAVLAFQKVNNLAQTGRVEAGTWQALARARAPRPRYRGDHLEVSKGRQVLFVVRDGRVVQTVHVSTGATGNTPVGRWYVYRKVSGWDWVLWYPMYFLRGFAIHGYPSVPAYPASHGCVRVPMWIAPYLWLTNPYGQTVYVYW